MDEVWRVGERGRGGIGSSNHQTRHTHRQTDRHTDESESLLWSLRKLMCEGEGRQFFLG